MGLVAQASRKPSLQQQHGMSDLGFRPRNRSRSISTLDSLPRATLCEVTSCEVNWRCLVHGWDILGSRRISGFTHLRKQRLKIDTKGREREREEKKGGGGGSDVF